MVVVVVRIPLGGEREQEDFLERCGGQPTQTRATFLIGSRDDVVGLMRIFPGASTTMVAETLPAPALRVRGRGAGAGAGAGGGGGGGGAGGGAGDQEVHQQAQVLYDFDIRKETSTRREVPLVPTRVAVVLEPEVEADQPRDRDRDGDGDGEETPVARRMVERLVIDAVEETRRPTGGGWDEEEEA